MAEELPIHTMMPLESGTGEKSLGELSDEEISKLPIDQFLNLHTQAHKKLMNTLNDYSRAMDDAWDKMDRIQSMIPTITGGKPTPRPRPRSLLRQDIADDSGGN